MRKVKFILTNMIPDRNQIKDVASIFLRTLDDSGVVDNDSLIARASLGSDKSPILVGSSEDYSDSVEFTGPEKGFVDTCYQRYFTIGGAPQELIHLRLDYTHGEGTIVWFDCRENIPGYRLAFKSSLRKVVGGKNFSSLRDELKRLSELG